MTELTQMYLQSTAHLIQLQGAAAQAFLRQQQNYLQWLQEAFDRYIPPRKAISTEEATRRIEEAATSAAVQ